MHTNSTLSEQDKLVLHWGAALTVGAQDSYIFSLGPRTYESSLLLLRPFAPGRRQSRAQTQKK